VSSTARLLAPLARQFAAFFGVGLVAAVVHYGLLIGLVEAWRVDPVTAALAGYVAGGVVSYWLNRQFTYRSDRPHAEATWRFALVAAVGFFLTWGLHALVRAALPPGANHHDRHRAVLELSGPQAVDLRGPPLPA
jgi:putative flippase GtrA